MSEEVDGAVWPQRRRFNGKKERRESLVGEESEITILSLGFSLFYGFGIKVGSVCSLLFLVGFLIWPLGLSACS